MADADASGVLAPIADYYSAKLAEFGAQPRGVDWNGADGQSLRFAQLVRVFGDARAGSVADLGCGYGALLDYLDAHRPGFDNVGIDLSAAMIDAARERHGARGRFRIGSSPDAAVDYVVASGIFNVRLDATDDDWYRSILETVDAMDRWSTRGFAFNCLTSWSDEDRKRPDLFYADPTALFDHCKRHYARNVALLHDYELYEFTMIVRK